MCVLEGRWLCSYLDVSVEPPVNSARLVLGGRLLVLDLGVVGGSRPLVGGRSLRPVQRRRRRVPLSGRRPLLLPVVPATDSHVILVPSGTTFNYERVVAEDLGF